MDWINLTDAKKVHSLIDKVYKRKNLEIAWEKVKVNRGSGGIDGQTLEAFEEQLEQQLDRLQPSSTSEAGFDEGCAAQSVERDPRWIVDADLREAIPSAPADLKLIAQLKSRLQYAELRIRVLEENRFLVKNRAAYLPGIRPINGGLAVATAHKRRRRFGHPVPLTESSDPLF